MKKLVLILPCYNEELIIRKTYKTLSVFLAGLVKTRKISSDSRICFVNDGSKDATWKILQELEKKARDLILIGLSRNFGHQNALAAGLHTLKDKFDLFATLDADLQDDYSVIKKMIIHAEKDFSILPWDSEKVVISDHTALVSFDTQGEADTLLHLDSETKSIIFNFIIALFGNSKFPCSFKPCYSTSTHGLSNTFFFFY